MNPFRLGRVVDLDGKRGFAGGHVDHDVTGLGAREDAFFAQENLAHILGETNDCKNYIGGLGDRHG